MKFIQTILLLQHSLSIEHMVQWRESHFHVLARAMRDEISNPTEGILRACKSTKLHDKSS